MIIHSIGENGYTELPLQDWNKIHQDNSTLYWIDDPNFSEQHLEQFCNFIQLQSELKQEILASRDLPVFEAFEDYSFLAVNMLYKKTAHHDFVKEQLNIIIGNNFIYTLQKGDSGDVFQNIRQKIKINYRKYHKSGIDFLLIAMLDLIVEQYHSALEEYRAPLEDIEVLLTKKPRNNYTAKIIDIKGEINELKKITSPLKEELIRLRAESSGIIHKQNQFFLRDVLDRLQSLSNKFDTFREMIRDLMEFQYSNQNLQLNFTVKALTVISAVFIPLTFITGFFGMNFEFLPFIHNKTGVILISFVMLLIVGIQLYIMKRNKWF